MKLNSLIAARPVLCFIFLALLVLLVPTSLIPYWYKMTKHMEHEVELNTNQMHSGMQSQIKSIATLLLPINSSAKNLAKVISSSLSGTELLFSDIKTKVAPSLFQAFLTTPYLSQISYIAMDGLFFSYYDDRNQTLGLYSNSTGYTWYKQPVDRDTGKLYGDAIMINPLSVNTTSWFLKALNSSDGIGSLGTGWNKAKDALFLNTAGINGRGAVSLGFPVKSVTDLFTGINLFGGKLSLAINDGTVLIQGLRNARMIVVDNSVSFTLMAYPENTAKITPVKYVSCMDGMLPIGEKDYKVYCSQFEIAGVKTVYELAMPRKGLVSLVHKTSKLALILLIVMNISVLIALLNFVFILVRAAKKEMHLCASLIKQMDATQQAERKSMNKSLAVANASHDIRAALAGVTGLIELCYVEVCPGSELETNLRQMNVCTNDLLSLLNSILDTSKVEAGKMQLMEEDFSVGDLLEDVVDLFHPVAIRKGVEIILDPNDGSVLKFSNVKGDRGKLKQILSNLLSNAVKFTTEGHISVRVWVKKPSAIGNPTVVLSSKPHGLFQSVSCLFYKSKKARSDLEAVNAAQRDENAMEFTFEVDDTGKGIPKEKRRSVFENYVQVKEGEGGTGLGLGIVESLVRLMGGDIEIVDKENDEKGTCFRFNVFLAIREASFDDNSITGDKELSGDSAAAGTQLQHKNLTVKAPSPSLSIRTNSPRLNILSPGSRHEGSKVVLLIANEERRRIAQRMMENLGINVSVVSKWEYLHSTLDRLKSKFSIHSPHSSMGKTDLSSRSDSESASFKEVPLSAMEGTEHKLTVPLSAIEGTEHKLTVYKPRGAPNFILLVIDATAGPFSEIFNIVADFRRDLHCNCKVIWLDKLTSRSINFDGLEEQTVDPNDDVLLKPFHGSRLYKVIKLLPEFGGIQPKLHGKASRDASSSSYSKHPHRKGKSKSKARRQIQEEGSSSCEHLRRDIISSAPVQPNYFQYKTLGTQGDQGQSSGPRQTEIVEEYEKPLSGKRFLVAEDSTMLRRVAEINLKHLGATVEACENGQEALQLVCRAPKDPRDLGAPDILPYDYILMDCEMPIMDGYEATKLIRKKEDSYGVRTPIIALTAHSSGEEADKTIEAGMDVHLGKPLNRDHLLEAIRYIHSKFPYSSYSRPPFLL